MIILNQEVCVGIYPLILLTTTVQLYDHTSESGSGDGDDFNVYIVYHSPLSYT